MARSDTSPRVLAALDAKGSGARIEGIERAGRFLASGKPSDKNVGRIGRRLAEIAESDPRWQVRLAVARSLVHLIQHDTFVIALAPLLSDSNYSVRKAAKRAEAKRDDAGRRDFLKQQRGDLLRDALHEIERDPGPRAGKRALRAAYLYADTLMTIARHESANCLLTIDGCLAAIADGQVLPEPQRVSMVAEEIAVAKKQLETIETLLSSLKEMTPDFSMEVRQEDLGSILQAAFDQLVRNYERKGRKHVDVEIVPGRIVLEADRSRLLRAFMNILDNAIESYQDLPDIDSRPGITVETRLDGSSRRAVIEFRDSGKGIPEKEISRVFELFVSTKTGKARGVGLAVARNIIVHEHRGRIWPTSIVGKGTTFHVTLPLQQEGAK